MKFGKEFAVQMVQEWQEAYMDYNKLKSMLKDINIQTTEQATTTMATAATATPRGMLKRRASLYRAFSGLTNRYKPDSSTESHEDEVIVVSSVQEGLKDKKVEEVTVEANDLSKQMNALIALRIKVDNPIVEEADMVHLSDHELSSSLSSVAHPIQGGKHVAVVARTIYSHQDEKTTTGLVLATATSGIATMASLYWDIVKDWGLLNRNSANPWLRDKLAVPHKGVYYVAMVLNCVLRLAWMQQVLGIQTVPFLHKTALAAVVASLEIVRRGIWNFFRLENEHLNMWESTEHSNQSPYLFHSDSYGDKSR
ncbi:hypothetical protein GQ457_16G010460 [Hibiscus cannabinus]